MKRTLYKGYVIDADNLGRQYIHNTASPYSEDSDRELLHGVYKLKDIKAYIDALVDGGGATPDSIADYARSNAR